MEDKDIKRIINNIKNDSVLEDQLLKIEEDIFFGENIPRVGENDKLKIKNMVSEKLYNKNIDGSENQKQNRVYNKSKFKSSKNYIKVASITGIVIGAIAIGYPIAASIIDNFYNYIPNEGTVVQSLGDVYILEKPIIENIDGKEIKLESIIVDLGNQTITTKVLGSNISIRGKSSIKIGNTTLESNDYSQAGGGGEWTSSYGFSGDFEYKDDENVVYTITCSNGENIEFNTKLKKVESTSDYKNLGNTDIKNKIAITAISTQEDNILDVNFISKVEGKDTSIYSYGDSFYSDGYDTGIVLKDANGKIVNGKLIHHGDRGNNFQFDTTDLARPYTIEIPSVTLSLYGVLEGEDISLKLPTKGAINIDKEITLKGSNEFIVSENNKVIVKSIENVDENQYKINFEYPKNNSSDFKITNLDLDARKSIFSSKRDFTGYSSDLNIDTEALDSITFEPENKNKKTVSFKLYPDNYKVEGNWKITIE